MNLHPKSLRIAIAAVLALTACGGDSGTTARDAASEPPPEEDASEPAGEGDAGEPPDCYEQPTDHLQIINACTGAEKIEKEPTLPLLLEDGGLPDLP